MNNSPFISHYNHPHCDNNCTPAPLTNAGLAVTQQLMQWVTTISRSDLVRSNRLADQQSNRLDQSSDRNGSKKQSNNRSKIKKK